MMGQQENYRVALPIGKQENISKKFWDLSNQQLLNNYSYSLKNQEKHDNF